ncbi:hypothetical protein SCACP_28030 [Sporomusa carbonis]
MTKIAKADSKTKQVLTINRNVFGLGLVTFPGNISGGLVYVAGAAWAGILYITSGPVGTPTNERIKLSEERCQNR